MAEFLSQFSLFPLVLTLGAYLAGQWIRKKLKSPLFNPILVAAVLVILVLLVTKLPVADYQAGTASISWLLTPATVALAVPMYRQVQALRKNLLAILAGIVAGALSSLVYIFGLCRLFGLDSVMTISLLPKSITTAMGMVLSEQSGGIAALTTMAIFITGILGSLVGPGLCRLLRLKDPVAQGVALGTASHAVGTYTATEMGELQGAVSSLSLAVAGVLTAIIFPLVCTVV